jgi:predicted glycoside hydrolase/deacetylase ChbG (UPF0249 family)
MYKKLESINFLVNELVCHPGHYDFNCECSYNRKREDEINILKSKDFIEKYLNKLELINYKQF